LIVVSQDSYRVWKTTKNFGHFPVSKSLEKIFWSVSMEKKIIKSGKRPQKDLEKFCKKYGNLYSKLQRNLGWQNFISTRGMKPVLREIFLGY